MKLSTKIIIGIFTSVILSTPFVVYLKVLPAAVSNHKFINFVEKQLENSIGLKADIKNPVLKTSLRPEIEFKVDRIDLTGKTGHLFEADNFDIILSFKEIFAKNIIIYILFYCIFC